LEIVKEKIDGKIVLITGASSGIGRELAIQLAELDCKLILVARRQKLLEQLTSQLPGGVERHSYYSCDVSKLDDVGLICKDMIATKKIPHVLILNAGISKSLDIRSFNISQIKEIFDTNFWGVLNFLEFLLPHLLSQNCGHLVFMSSLAGYRGMPKAAPYSSSKAALGIFLESLRIDLWKTNLKTTLLSPGFVITPLTDKNKYTMPFKMNVNKAAKKTIKGIEANKAEIHFPKMLSYIAKLSKLIPYKIYARIMSSRRP
jgi:short-subunit dehydrogenase